MPGRPGVALTVDGQRWTSANDATARAIGGSNCDAKHGAQRPARRIDHRREGFNFDTSVACRSCETALTLWQQSTCRVSKPRRGARAARVGRPRRGGHADPSRSSGLVSSRHPCACTFDSTIITRIAARVSKPCGVGALLAPHARPLPVAHPPSRCISLRWRRQASASLCLHAPRSPLVCLLQVCGVRGVNFHFFAVLPFFGPETPLIPYFPRTEIGKNQKNHDSGTGHVFSFRVGIWGRRQGPEAPCFSRQTRGQPRRAERGCWVGFFSCLFHKYEKIVPCPEHLPHLAFYIYRTPGSSPTSRWG